MPVKVIKEVHDLIVSHFVTVFVFVNMGLSLTLLRIEFSRFRSQANNINIYTREMELLKKTFCELPGANLEKLKQLHAKVFSVINWGRMMVFLSFCEQIGLTEDEWEHLFHFLVPTLSQIRE